MIAFLRNVLATIVGLFLFFVISIFILAGIGSAFSTSEIIQIPEGSVLEIDLTVPIQEKPVENPFEGLDIFPGAGENALSLVEVKDAIIGAAEDENIEGIFIKSGFMFPGFAMAEEIRNAIKVFQQSGKWVMAYGQFMSEGSYYVSAVANQVYLHPEGEMELNGLRQRISFFKGTFEKLHIEPQIFRVGKFKSYVEPFTRKEMSEANRMQTSIYLESLNNHMLQEIAHDRKIEDTRLFDISENMEVRDASDAFELKLVDGLLYYDQLITRIKQKLEIEEEKEIDLTPLSKYIRYRKGDKPSYKKDKIAVIVGEGEIVPGEGNRDNIGGDRYAQEIRKARLDDKIKAIVLRVNSPGGNALASDVIWREVQLASQVKPIIASMSNVAASGGYYISMAADTIVAQPNTITGSIGIFGMIFNLQGLMENKLGITSDVVSTGEFSDIITVSRPLNEQEKQIIQKLVEDGYETFTTKAAEGRHMSLDDLKELAEGRVWTGVYAKASGLVDVLGGIDDAITIAANSASLEEGDYRLVYLPKEKPILEEIIENIVGDLEASSPVEGELHYYYEKIKALGKYHGIMARLPYDIDIE